METKKLSQLIDYVEKKIGNKSLPIAERAKGLKQLKILHNERTPEQVKEMERNYVVNMENTTDIIITCFEEEWVVKSIEELTGIDLPKITESERCGGQKITFFESYAACYRSLGEAKINKLIDVFKKAPWECPDLAIMIIGDDDGLFSGCVTVDARITAKPLVAVYKLKNS